MNDAATLKAVARALADERAAFSVLLTEMRTERSSELYEVVLELQTGIGAAKAAAAEALAFAQEQVNEMRAAAHDMRMSLESLRAVSVERTVDLDRRLSAMSERVEFFGTALDRSKEQTSAHIEELREASRATETRLTGLDGIGNVVAGRVASIERFVSVMEQKASSQDIAEALSAARSAAEASGRVEALLNERVSEIWRTIKHEIFPPMKDAHKETEAIKSRLSELADINVELTSISDTAASALDASQTAELLARQSGIALRESLHQIQEDWTNPKDWLRGGAGYQANSVVLHGGGTWVSVTATKAEPGQGEDWRLVVDTLVDISAEQNAEDRTKIDLVQRMASGRVQRSTVALPLPRYLDTWEDHREYDLLDSVVWGNSRYLKTVAGQLGEPGKDKGWAMVGMHGPRGRPGETKQGPQGIPGVPGHAPTMDEILSAFMAHAEARGLFHSMRWSGDWVYGADYAPMDVVRMGRGIYLKSAPGEDRAPADPQSSTWQCLISGD